MKKQFLSIPEHIADQFWAIYLSVCDTMGIDPDRARLKSRKREIVLTRQISTYMMFQNTIAGPSEIGAFFSQDHATASHSKSAINHLLDSRDPMVCECYNRSVIKYRSGDYSAWKNLDFILHAATTFR